MNVTNICFKASHGEDSLQHEQNQFFRQFQLEIISLVGLKYLSTGIDIITVALNGTIIHQESNDLVEQDVSQISVESLCPYSLPVYNIYG